MAYAASFAQPSRASRSPSRSHSLFGALKTAIAQRRLYNRTVEELKVLTDRELADLGISRLSIAQVAHEAAYGK